MDIGVNTGTTIVTPRAGTVTYAGSLADYGLVVIVRHDSGFETLYAYRSRLLVWRGQRVQQGQALARSGNTGVSTGPHLHYEVHYRGTSLDPTPFLRAP